MSGAATVFGAVMVMVMVLFRRRDVTGRGRCAADRAPEMSGEGGGGVEAGVFVSDDGDPAPVVGPTARAAHTVEVAGAHLSAHGGETAVGKAERAGADERAATRDSTAKGRHQLLRTELPPQGRPRQIRVKFCQKLVCWFRRTGFK
ncbi:hypothetical protein GCM10022225_77650 [Plantactinospora mayteni]|uniref:Uncharacterized protein n=1 Tax=Plantactinospora mayteni TaxID=566021 RepID=A0ABQ4F2R0_9ACTN|nr:hypothetical protein Pma05_77710 [Plantactinospora mayteni]